MARYAKDRGFVIKKSPLMGDNVLITLFSMDRGKHIAKAYGLKKIKSRRASHVETGNLINFSSYEKSGYATLGQTELIYGYSKVRRSEIKLQLLFVYLFVLNKILHENQPEPALFSITTDFFKSLNNKSDFGMNDMLGFFRDLMLAGGFLSQEKLVSRSFDTLAYVEEVVGSKIDFRYLS